jgi:hypothetical protein
MSHVGSIMVLAVTCACASSDRATGPTNGPYIAARPEAYEGRVIRAGYCVNFVRAAAAGLPRTAAWQEGARVRGNHNIARGTAIATFESDGGYTSETGNHAVIYLSQDDDGIWVYDQWQGQPGAQAPDSLRGRGRRQARQQEQRRQALRRDRVA